MFCDVTFKNMAASFDNSEIFSNLSSKIINLFLRRTEGNQDLISKTLDDLNSLNYRYPIITNATEAVLLVNQCCSFIPTDDSILVQKYSQLLWNLIRQQNLSVEGKTLTLTVQWCLNGLQIKDKNIILVVLQALDALLRSNVNKQSIQVGYVVREICKFLKKNQGTLETTLLALQCLEACTTLSSENQKADSDLHKPLELCSEVFLSHLTENLTDSNDLITNKILQTCCLGLQNVILQYPEYLMKELGTVLGVIKTFMLLGIKNVDYIMPQKLMPSALSIPEMPSLTREKKGGKLTKQKKHRVSGTQKKGKINQSEHDTSSGGYIPATTCLDYNSDSGVSGVNSGNKIKTSDSDFSDSESGKAAKLQHVKTKVRRAALNLFFIVVKNTEKSTMFTYWSSFIPEDNMSGQHNLVTCFLRDPSARNRMSALNVLLLLLTTSKLYLAQAESSDKSTSFTPYSVVLGRMITELHRSLSLILHEISVPVLTQALKCYAALIQATPYHRMSSRLMTKVIRNIKPFLYHKDASVQVTALIALGCVLASEPVLPETIEAMLKLESALKNKVAKNDDSLLMDDIDSLSINDSFEYADFDEPEEAEESDSRCGTGIPWLLKRCLVNLGVEMEESESSKGAAPVKLESLQILSAMSTKYFENLILPHLSLIVKALDQALLDSYVDLKLHAGRTVDFIGQAMSKFLSNEDKLVEIPITQCVNFWKTLLNKSLVDLFQFEENPILRAVACDCLGSIGPHIFEQLPRDKQILCVTLLFSCTRDGENSVKGAAVRALAICVTYPSLREDTGFVLDTAEAIYRTLKDDHLSVREKASWSLGNLSGALVLSSTESKEAFEEISSEMILKLLKACICGTSDNDKVKMNCVRGIGNLLQLVTEEMLKNEPFPETVDKAFAVLVKCCTTGSNMKVNKYHILTYEI
ncbi:unnamed protein product [Acanthoscelides obtectus]|uniref:HEAT repeat-containing protein 6 n=1 Tax=Acanthoscelides obtectus TaxID=200917 RepID=A0A9P0QAF3_ACAOB|nr:unnamed protein product [Acanthoscelides obtectus]CAK1630376.1 HEAT repeat-containing protein 6 [Acanthoscelides obtectus]